MRFQSSRSILALVLLPLALACGAADEPATEATGEPAATAPAATAAAPAAAPEASPAAAPATAPGSAPAAAPAVAPGTVLAAQETNWSGVVAEVTEFRRKGNTLTAKLRFRNQGGDTSQPDVNYGEAYLMDPQAGKKYEVLKDEKGAYIAALRSGWSDRWYSDVQAGQSAVIWMKFPAPPPEVTAVTLQVPGMPPFDDLSIQDS